MRRVPVMQIMPCPPARQHGGARVGRYRVAVDIAAFQRLLTPEGQAVLAEVADGDVSDPALLATASRLRARHAPELVGAALTQARLRVRARAKFGACAGHMYFTP